MKILYHHRTLADGAEGIHIAEMVAAFRELGHEVHLLGLAASADQSARRGWIASIRRWLPSAVFEAASMAGNAIEYIEVRRAIMRVAPDFVYKRHARNDVAALAAARRAGVPSVLEVNCLFTGPSYRMFEPIAFERLATALEKRALRLATVRLAVSSPLAAQIETLSGASAVVLPNGVDPRRFDPDVADSGAVRARHRLGAGLVIGWSGVLREWHGLELLLEALSRTPHAKLLIVGDGPSRPAVESHAARLDVGDRVVITGRVAHDTMPDYLAAMDVAVVAADRTGVASPMKLLEYMAMGRAIVAPRLENITDVLADGQQGLLFTPGDADTLTAAVASLAANPQLRADLGRSARARVQTTLNWLRNATRVVQLAQTTTMPAVRGHHVR